MSTFLPQTIVIDNEKTFGELTFQRLKFMTMEQDAEGNDTDVVKLSHVDVKSKAQYGAIAIKVKGELPKNVKFGTSVELVDPIVEPYSVQIGETNRYNSGISITVSGIKAKYPKAQNNNPTN